jgi:quinol monooxygenase YgiN
VVTNQIQPGKMDAWVDLIRNAVVPSLKEQPGFRGFVALVNREAGKSIGYSTWETEQDLVASEASGSYQQQIAKLGAVLAMPPVREVHELVVVS